VTCQLLHLFTHYTLDAARATGHVLILFLDLCNLIFREELFDVSLDLTRWDLFPCSETTQRRLFQVTLLLSPQSDELVLGQRVQVHIVETVKAVLHIIIYCVHIVKVEDGQRVRWPLHAMPQEQLFKECKALFL